MSASLLRHLQTLPKSLSTLSSKPFAQKPLIHRFGHSLARYKNGFLYREGVKIQDAMDKIEKRPFYFYYKPLITRNYDDHSESHSHSGSHSHSESHSHSGSHSGAFEASSCDRGERELYEEHKKGEIYAESEKRSGCEVREAVRWVIEEVDEENESVPKIKREETWEELFSLSEVEPETGRQENLGYSKSKSKRHYEKGDEKIERIWFEELKNVLYRIECEIKNLDKRQWKMEKNIQNLSLKSNEKGEERIGNHKLAVPNEVLNKIECSAKKLDEISRKTKLIFYLIIGHLGLKLTFSFIDTI